MIPDSLTIFLLRIGGYAGDLSFFDPSWILYNIDLQEMPFPRLDYSAL